MFNLIWLLVIAAAWFVGMIVFVALDGLIGFEPTISDSELPFVSALWPITMWIIIIYMIYANSAKTLLAIRYGVRNLTVSVRNVFKRLGFINKTDQDQK